MTTWCWRCLSQESFTRRQALLLSRLDCCNGVLAELPASQLTLADSSPFSTRQRDWFTASVDTTTWHHCCSSFTGCLWQNAWISNSASWCIAVLHGLGLEYFSAETAFGLQYRRRASCHTPVLATAHFRSQELGHGTRYRPVSPPRRSGDFWKVYCFSDNCMDNINYRFVVPECSHSAPR